MLDEQLLERGRAAAEALMRDTFTPHSYGWTKVDGLDVQTWTAKTPTIGKLAGRGGRDTDTRTVTVGDVERPVIEGGLHIPLGAERPEIGWEYECTAVGPGSDPTLLGRRWRVVDVPAKSHATARRLDVVEVEV